MMSTIGKNITKTPFGSEQCVFRRSNKHQLGKEFDEQKKTLVLDLDRTIVYQTMDVPNKQTNFVEISDNVKMKSFVVKRPGLDTFMKEMSSLYNVCIYSEEKSQYVKEVVKAAGLTPYIFKVYSRHHCTRVSEGVYMKSIMNLGLSLENTIFVDDSPNQIRSQPLNSILIQEFKGQSGDCALGYLILFLRYMSTLEDVRPVTENLHAYFEKDDKDEMEKEAEKIVKEPKPFKLLTQIDEAQAEEEKSPLLSIRRKRQFTLDCKVTKTSNKGFENISKPRDSKELACISYEERFSSLPSNQQIKKMNTQMDLVKGFALKLTKMFGVK